MIRKEICFKCHMKYYGVDGTNDLKVKCYPPPNASDRKQCESIFKKEWKDGKVWCFALDNECTDNELKEIFGEEKWNQPFISPSDNVPSVCYYRKEHKIK